MIEKCNIAALEISSLDVFNKSTVTTAVTQLETTKVSHLIVTNSEGISIFDSIDPSQTETQYALYPEIVEALNGNNVFSGNYHEGTIQSRAATPIYSYGTLIGCIYMMENDTQQGALIQSHQ